MPPCPAADLPSSMRSTAEMLSLECLFVSNDDESLGAAYGSPAVVVVVVVGVAPFVPSLTWSRCRLSSPFKSSPASERAGVPTCD